MKRDNREKRNKILLSVFIAAIMILSVLGFFYGTGGDENAAKYTINNKTYSFSRENNQYVVTLNKNEKVGFYYLPFEIELNMSDEIANSIKNSMVIYLTFDPEAANPSYIDVVRFDLANTFVSKQIYVIDGITEENEKFSLPIVSCGNATAYVPVILLQEANITSLEMENNCIKMQGKSLDFIKFRDLVIYKLYGIL